MLSTRSLLYLNRFFLNKDFVDRIDTYYPNYRIGDVWEYGYLEAQFQLSEQAVRVKTAHAYHVESFFH